MTDRPGGDQPASSGGSGPDPVREATPGNRADEGSADESGRLQCQFCGSYSVGRMYLASTGVDSCECQTCGARWEEERASGRYLGRGGSHSIITKRHR